MIKSASTSVIKYANTLNHYSIISKMINREIVRNECSRHSKPELCDHAIRYQNTKDFRREFVKDLLANLIKEKLGLD